MPLAAMDMASAIPRLPPACATSGGAAVPAQSPRAFTSATPMVFVPGANVCATQASQVMPVKMGLIPHARTTVRATAGACHAGRRTPSRRRRGTTARLHP